MKFGVTADIHLASYHETPERYHALENIMQQLKSEHIKTLLICGDLFNANFNNYADFERLAKANKGLSIWIIPGNHDANVSSRNLVGENIKVFEEVEIIEDGYQLVLIPYKAGKTMGELIAEKAEQLNPNRWILFSHGDYLEGLRIPNPIESGTYMPLTRTDIEHYQPAKVFLGHIHARLDGLVNYPGSPCGIDITETGQRRFLIYDSQAQFIESREVKTDIIYQTCRMTMLPVDNEAAFIKKLIQEFKDSWEIKAEELDKTKIRVQVQGYTMNKSELNRIILDEFKDFSFYKDESPDLEMVSTVQDQNRIKIAQMVKEKIDSFVINPAPDEPDKDQVLLRSLSLIFED